MGPGEILAIVQTITVLSNLFAQNVDTVILSDAEKARLKEQIKQAKDLLPDWE